MRKIEKQLRSAFFNDKEFKDNNSEIRSDGINTCLYLFNNMIAYKPTGPLHDIYTITFTLAGWNTLTTRSRLHNVTQLPIYNEKGIAHVNGSPIENKSWYRLHTNTDKPISVSGILHQTLNIR